MSTKRNIVANIAGRAWQAIMSFAFVPLYIHFLGVEAYGLIGIFVMLVAVFAVLDLGGSTTINRELGRLGTESGRAEGRTLLRTFEWLFWCAGFAIAVTVGIGADAIATSWLNYETLQPSETRSVIQLMAVTIFLRWPVMLYSGALMGLRQHVSLNLVTGIMAAFQGGGAVLVLWLVSPTPVAFFAWQIVVAAVQIVLLVALTWRKIAFPGHLASFRWAALGPVFGFSVGVTGIALLSTILMQLDRLMLSRLVTLEVFGYYVLASSIAMLLNAAGSAVFSAVLPSLSFLVAQSDDRSVADFYHKGSQLLALLVMPMSATIFFFAQELLAAYVQKPEVVANTHPILSVLILAYMLNAVMLMPLASQYAYGWTRLVLWTNAVVVVLFVPLLLYAINRFGAIGAAYVWLLVSANYILAMINMMHAKILKGQKARWYVTDFGAPLLVSFGTLGVLRVLAPAGLSRLEELVLIGFGFGLASLLCAAIMPAIRNHIVQFVSRRNLVHHA